jgi:hypothetical protein
MGKVPETLRDQLGIVVAQRTYKAYRELLASPLRPSGPGHGR